MWWAIIYLALLVVALFYTYLVFEAGKQRGIDQATFYMFSQVFCEEEFKTGREIINSFNDTQEEAEQVKISYVTGYRWLDKLALAGCVERVDGNDHEGNVRYYRTLPIKDIV